jgi:hypothetical protein
VDGRIENAGMLFHTAKKFHFVLKNPHLYIARKITAANIFGTEIFGYFYFTPIVADTHLPCQNLYFTVGQLSIHHTVFTLSKFKINTIFSIHDYFRFAGERDGKNPVSRIPVIGLFRTSIYCLIIRVLTVFNEI